MPISKPDYQLTLPLDLEEVSGSTSQVSGEVLSAEEVRLRSETARAALAGVDVAWKGEYQKLVEGGWNWRVAAYIAWASSPKASRTPKTQDELAQQHLGLTSDRAINTWRKRNPAIDEMVAVLQAAPLWEHRSEIYAALVSVATSHEYKGHNDRKLALELLGDYVPAAKLEAILRGSAKGSDVDAEDEDTLGAIERAAGQLTAAISGERLAPPLSASTQTSPQIAAEERGDLGGEDEGEEE
jgi:hypothetical protein